MTNRDEAIATLSQLVDAQASPVISTDRLGEIVDAAQIKDANGRAPSDPLWVPTYDLAYAAADAYELKAVMVGVSAPGIRRFEAEGTKFERDRGPSYEDYMNAARYWRTRATGTITTAISVIEMLPKTRAFTPRSDDLVSEDVLGVRYTDTDPRLIIRWGLPTL